MVKLWSFISFATQKFRKPRMLKWFVTILITCMVVLRPFEGKKLQFLEMGGGSTFEFFSSIFGLATHDLVCSQSEPILNFEVSYGLLMDHIGRFTSAYNSKKRQIFVQLEALFGRR